MKQKSPIYRVAATYHVRPVNSVAMRAAGLERTGAKLRQAAVTEEQTRFTASDIRRAR